VEAGLMKKLYSMSGIDRLIDDFIGTVLTLPFYPRTLFDGLRYMKTQNSCYFSEATTTVSTATPTTGTVQ